MSPVDDSDRLILQLTEPFVRWRSTLRDRSAAARIAARLDRLAEGRWGDAKSVGDGVVELRLHFGPGYRLYVVRSGKRLVVLLCGGDKASQSRDIQMARQMALELSDDDKDLSV